MGESADAYLMYGYMMPKRGDDYDWDAEDDSRGDEDLWFAAHAPDEIKALDLTVEEKADWNSLPYYGGYGHDRRTEEQKARYEDYAARHGIFYDAKCEWLKENPVPAKQQLIGHYESDESFLALVGADGEKMQVWANWEAVPVDFSDPMFDVDQKRAKTVLDSYLRDIGYEPPSEQPSWHLIPYFG